MPFFILRRKYFSNPTLARWTQRPFFAHVTSRGGIWGMATNATPVSPISARQTAFHVAFALASSPFMDAFMFWTAAATMLSVMKPVLGTPTGRGVASGGAIAIETPTAYISGYLRDRWNSSTITNPLGLQSPSTAATASTPLKAGIIMA